MHEYSVTKALVDLCNQEADKHGLEHIRKIRIKLGKFTGFSPDSIRFYFDYLNPKTKCRYAELLFDEIPICIRCNVCGKESELIEPILLCPHCNAVDIEIMTGREFYVESIEGE